MKIKALAVFCGSKYGNDPIFAEHAKQVGTILADNGISLIYGGGSKGLMGAIADTIVDRKGMVSGVIPQVLVDSEHQHQGITQLLVVEDMHARKKKLYELCDAALILAGGVGTLDELFEIITWNQLSIHDKKIFLLNSNGFYNHLISHLKKMEKEDFLYEPLSNYLNIIEQPEQLIPLVKELPVTTLK